MRFATAFEPKPNRALTLCRPLRSLRVRLQMSYYGAAAGGGAGSSDAAIDDRIGAPSRARARSSFALSAV